MINRTRHLNPHRVINDALNERRAIHAERLLHHLRWHGGKILFDETAYRRARQEIKLTPYQIDTAADDLFTLALANINVAGERHMVLTLLAAERPA